VGQVRYYQQEQLGFIQEHQQKLLQHIGRQNLFYQLIYE